MSLSIDGAGMPATRCARLCARSLTALAMLVGSLGVLTAASADTLDDIRDRGAVVCGVNTGLAGFAQANSLGEYAGFDIDFCRALATAILGDASRAEYVPTSSVERFDDLIARDFDILTRNTTWTLDRNARFGEFIGVNYYDGQGFMVRKRTGIRSALELDNRSICVDRGTTTELNAVDFFLVTGIRYRPVSFDGDAQRGYADGECDAISTDRSGLAAIRTTLDEPDAHVVLPEVISKEPLGPMVRANDSRFANIARWTLACMINAEEMGIDSRNVDDPDVARNPAARRLLGLEGEAGAALGLAADWCRAIVRDIGNYGESYERHVGPDTPLGLARGVNGLWTDGGLLYAPPIR